MTSLMVMVPVIVSMADSSLAAMTTDPASRPGGDDGQKDGLFRRLEAVRLFGFRDDEGADFGRLLAAPGEESALSLHDVKHDPGRRRVRRDLLSRRQAEDDDAHRVGIVQELRNGSARREFRRLPRVHHGEPPFLSVPSGRRHRMVIQRLTTPRTIPANWATLPVQRRTAAAGARKPMTIPAVASAAIQKWAAAHASLCSGFPAKRGRMW